MRRLHIESPKGTIISIEGKEYNKPTVIAADDCDEVAIAVMAPFANPSFHCGVVRVVIEGGKIISLSEGARAVIWDNDIDIYITPPPYYAYHSPTALAQESINNGLITLYEDGSYHLLCEAASCYQHDLPYLNSYELKVTSSGDAPLVALRGRCEDEEYFLALTYKENWKVLHEHRGHTITIVKDGIQVIETKKDMRAHRRTLIYKPDGSVIKSSDILSPHTFLDELVPYLFFEAILIDDQEETMSYVSRELNQEYDSIKEFLGEFDNITQHPYSPTQNIIALFNSKNHIANPCLYRVENRNGLITNIVALD